MELQSNRLLIRHLRWLWSCPQRCYCIYLRNCHIVTSVQWALLANYGNWLWIISLRLIVRNTLLLPKPRCGISQDKALSRGFYLRIDTQIINMRKRGDIKAIKESIAGRCMFGCWIAHDLNHLQDGRYVLLSARSTSLPLQDSIANFFLSTALLRWEPWKWLIWNRRSFFGRIISRVASCRCYRTANIYSLSTILTLSDTQSMMVQKVNLPARNTLLLSKH